MSQSSLFSSGLTLAPFVISSGLLPISWNATTSTESGINSKEGVRLSWKVHSVSSQEKDLKIVVFETIPVSQDHVQVDLVSSSDRKKKNFLDFELLCTQRNPIFSVNNTAVSLLHENHEMLDQLKTEVHLLIFLSLYYVSFWFRFENLQAGIYFNLIWNLIEYGNFINNFPCTLNLEIDVWISQAYYLLTVTLF